MLKPRELEHLYRWTFELQQLRACAKMRSLSDADWRLLGKLLDRIQAGEDVRAYFHGHAAQEKGGRKSREAARARKQADAAAAAMALRELHRENPVKRHNLPAIEKKLAQHRREERIARRITRGRLQKITLAAIERLAGIYQE